MIYETMIPEATFNCVDIDTGEIIDPTAYEIICKHDKTFAEQLALEIKNCRAEAKAIKDEVKNLQEKAVSAENRAERCKKLLRFVLHGEKMKTPRCSVYYRTSKSVDVRADFEELIAVNPNFVRIRHEYNKTAIKEALENGQIVPKCEITEKESVIVR